MVFLITQHLTHLRPVRHSVCKRSSGSLSQEGDQDCEPCWEQTEDSHWSPSAVPSWRVQDGVPPWGAEGKKPPENRDMREVALISLKQPFGEFKAGASPGMGVSGLALMTPSLPLQQL